MTEEQIRLLLTEGGFPETPGKRQLVETHISWVILCEQYVYKIKKPLHYSFLDFSTLEKRQFYCEREVMLNNRLSHDIYLGVLPVRLQQGRIAVTGDDGEIIDYAVKMRKMDRDRQMDALLRAGKVTPGDMERLAETIAAFHQHTRIITDKDYMDVREQFRDLETQQDYLSAQLEGDSPMIIARALDVSDAFMEAHRDLLASRLRDGFFRDCHGDLHARNIFLLPEPQPFDCIEFNDDFRCIDVLNEVAFLCMDLDACGRQDLGERFMHRYNERFPTMRSAEERRLFNYYKGYRANVRAKVSSLRARSATAAGERAEALSTANKYLQLLNGYIGALDT